MTEAKRALDMFVCKVLPGSPRLTTKECTTNYGRARESLSSPCRHCSTGLAHVQAELPSKWPDGTPIERRQIGGAPVSPRATDAASLVPATTTSTDEATMTATVRTITHAGRTATLREWAEERGLAVEALRQRLARGWTESEAVSTPKGEVPPRLANASGTVRTKPVRGVRTPAAVAVREQLTSLDPVELLSRLGYEIEDLGTSPLGRIVLIKGAS